MVIIVGLIAGFRHYSKRQVANVIRKRLPNPLIGSLILLCNNATKHLYIKIPLRASRILIIARTCGLLMQIKDNIWSDQAIRSYR